MHEKMHYIICVIVSLAGISDGVWRGEKLLNLKQIADGAINLCAQKYEYCFTILNIFFLINYWYSLLFLLALFLKITFSVFTRSHVVECCVVVQHLTPSEEDVVAGGTGDASDEEPVAKRPTKKLEVR